MVVRLLLPLFLFLTASDKAFSNEKPATCSKYLKQFVLPYPWVKYYVLPETNKLVIPLPKGTCLPATTRLIDEGRRVVGTVTAHEQKEVIIDDSTIHNSLDGTLLKRWSDSLKAKHPSVRWLAFMKRWFKTNPYLTTMPPDFTKTQVINLALVSFQKHDRYFLEWNPYTTFVPKLRSLITNYEQVIVELGDPDFLVFDLSGRSRDQWRIPGAITPPGLQPFSRPGALAFSNLLSLCDALEAKIKQTKTQGSTKKKTAVLYGVPRNTMMIYQGIFCLRGQPELTTFWFQDAFNKWYGNTSKPLSPTSSDSTLTYNQLAKLIEKKQALVISSLPIDEITKDAIPGTRPMSYHRSPHKPYPVFNLSSFPRTKYWVVYGRDRQDLESLRMFRLLRRQHNRVYWYRGGLSEWTRLTQGL